MIGLVAPVPAARPAATEAGPPAPDVLTATRVGRVIEVIDGDTVRLAGGDEVRLVGLQAPKLPLGRTGFEPWPRADEARAALAGLVLDREVRLAFGPPEATRRRDRHGRILAHLVRPDGLWVQGRLLADGMARVYTFADNRAAAGWMLALEASARAAGRGIWNHPYYEVRRPEAAGGDIGTFQVVVGRVVDAAEVRGRIYLNYGADWREDFTATLDPATVRLFRGEGIEPLDLEGRRLRVRGWIQSYNGPMIEITHPEQIEVLSP